jgi:hypothetical protein
VRDTSDVKVRKTRDIVVARDRAHVRQQGGSARHE